MKQPFEGVRVLDITHVLAGPYCGYQLALLGAETLKIEHPEEPDPTRARGPVPTLNAAGLGFTYLIQNANKKSLTLDLKTAEGKEIFKRLAKEADVIVENFRSGAFDALGLGYEEIRKINPRIIYCSITAFGQTGPWATTNAYDPAIQAMSGIMARTGGGVDRPVMPGAPFIDYATGLYAAYAVAAALLHRERTGEGQRIDTSMMDCALIMTGPALITDDYRGEKKPTPQEAGTSCYRTKDGFFQLGAYNFRQNRKLWLALGRPEFAGFKSWPEMWDNAAAMRKALEEIMPTRTSAEWEAFVKSINVPGGRIRTLEEAVHLEHIEQRGLMHKLPKLQGLDNVRVPVTAFKYANGGGPRIAASPPTLGQNNADVLGGLGYSAADIAKLRDKKVI